jgi:hypothetical protein
MEVNMKKYLIFLSLGITAISNNSFAMLGKVRQLNKATKQIYRFQTNSENKFKINQTKTDPKLNLVKALIDLDEIYCNNTWFRFRNNKNLTCNENFLDSLKIQNTIAIDAINRIQKNLKETNITSDTKDTLNNLLKDMLLNINKNTDLIDALEHNNPQIFSKYYTKQYPSYIQKLKKYFFSKSPQFNKFTEAISNNYNEVGIDKSNCFLRIGQDQKLFYKE